MTVPYLDALAALAVSFSVLLAGARVARQRTGNSGWVDATWTLSLGLARAGSALRPVAGAGPQSLLATNAERVCAEIALKMKGVVT